MLSNPDGPFINLARLDMSKYAAKPTLAKALFEYIFHHENDVRNVSELSFFIHFYKAALCTSSNHTHTCYLPFGTILNSLHLRILEIS